MNKTLFYRVIVWLKIGKIGLRKIILDLKGMKKLKALYRSGVVIISMGDLK